MSKGGEANSRAPALMASGRGHRGIVHIQYNSGQLSILHKSRTQGRLVLLEKASGAHPAIDISWKQKNRSRKAALSVGKTFGRLGLKWAALRKLGFGWIGLKVSDPEWTSI